MGSWRGWGAGELMFEEHVLSAGGLVFTLLLVQYDPKGPKDVQKMAEDSSVFVLPFDFLSGGALSGLEVVVVLEAQFCGFWVKVQMQY
ncbi:hypothetical protein Dimus_002441 [Dionaea muscipula]